MKYLLICSTCISSVCAKDSTFSVDRLTKFYDNFVREEKQVLAHVNLTTSKNSFWISPHGSDSSPGTQQAPFLTLEHARNVVRALSASSDQDIYVYLEEGTYRLQQPLLLDGRDSGKNGHNIIYSAAPGAHPVISGAIKVSNWRVSEISPNIYVAKITPCRSRQLYINHRRAERARTPSYPPGFLPQWAKGGIEFIPICLDDQCVMDPQYWTNLQEIEAVIETQWKMMRVPIQTIIPYSASSNGLITLQEPAWNNANVYFEPLAIEHSPMRALHAPSMPIWQGGSLTMEPQANSSSQPGAWSFWHVTWFENALEFLTEPGQWYLNSALGNLYYFPLPGEDLNTADIELPILEALIIGQGTAESPLHHVRFEGLTFSYATWLSPSSNNGYVADQSGQLLVGSNHLPNFIGHDQHVVPTPGNLSFIFANNLVFYGNIFEHLGAVGLQFGTGSHNNTIDSNLFTDISSAAIELGAVTTIDAHPNTPNAILKDNRITNNLITTVANEYVDAPAIFIGFTQNTLISHNTCSDIPWSAIAIGWGWGLLDPGSFPGLPNATSGMWGTITSPTPNLGCKILYNKIYNFLNVLWDGGAIYTCGQQGPSLDEGLLIEGNVAHGKRSTGGGNIFYTDGGSRHIRLRSNVSYNNPIGKMFFSPPPRTDDPFRLQYPLYYIANGAPYGSDSGGCTTYGDIMYEDNYWLETPLPEDIITYNDFYHSLLDFYPYVDMGFFDPCPCNLRYENNHIISSVMDIPTSLLSNAGVQRKPPTIPQFRWILPP